MAGTPKLIVLSSEFKGKQFELTNDLHTVGRADARDICIKDSSLSSYHCDFIRAGDTYIVRDHDSTNGTRVNNVPITEQELMNSDIIQIGGVEVLYDADLKEGTRSTTTSQKTVTGITITDIDPDTVNLGTTPEAAPAGEKKERLILIGIISVLVIAVLALGFILVHHGN